MSKKLAAECFHPFDFIAEEIAARGWTLEDLAARMGGDYGINLLALQMYDAVREPNCRMGDETAEGLARAFGVSPQLFLNLERLWRAWAERGQKT